MVKRIVQVVGVAVVLALGVAPRPHAQGTVAPVAKQQFLDANGHPLAGGKLYVYQAGTTTPAAIYADSALSTPLANPALLDASGRLTYFLAPSSYRFTLKTAADALVWDVDNVSSVPSFAINLDISGTAGEAITALAAVYLSDGSGGKTAGRWYKADAANAYSSTTPEVGVAPAAIDAGAVGSIRLQGQTGGLNALSVGSTYYVGTAGALTSTAPSNSRPLGVADSTSSLVMSATVTPGTVANNIVQGRLTLTAATPITIADVTAATTLRFTPYQGNLIALYNGVGWSLFTFSELTIAVPATTSQMYDVFVYDNSGTRALELLAWTNDTTRATALTTQDGVLVKTGALTRRYVGSFRTTTVSGQTEDSLTKRYVWNYYNRVRRSLRVVEATDSWTYGTNTFRQANANAANQLDLVVGVAEVLASLRVVSSATSLTSWVAIGEDSSTTVKTGTISTVATSAGGTYVETTAVLDVYPPLGRHTYVWLEKASAASVTFYGDEAGAGEQSGITGWFEG